MGTIKHIGPEEYQPKIRYVGALKVYFKSKDTIFVTDGRVSVVFERWFEGNNFYKDSWRPLVNTLTKKKTISSVYEAWNIAARYDVARHQTFNFPPVAEGTLTIKEDK